MSKNKNDQNTNDAEKYNVSRRRFLKNSGYVAGGLVGGGVLFNLLSNPFVEEEKTSSGKDNKIDYSETRQFFKRDEDFEILSHITERIFPEDDNGPGAIELGVPYFIDKQLAGPWGSNTKMYMKKPFQKGEIPLTNNEMFLQGVRKINELSNKENGEKFADLEEQQQDEILTMCENSEIDMKNMDSGIFFTVLIQSTLEGVYSDPMYGGNKDMQGWAMKKYPGPRMSYLDIVEEGFDAIEKMDLKSLKTHS